MVCFQCSTYLHVFHIMFRRFYLFDSRRRFLIWITIDVVQQGEHFDMVGTENDLEYSGYFII